MKATRYGDPPAQADGAVRRSAWITGASSGIGRALAVRLAEEGWTVAVSARDAQALAALAAEAAGRIHAFPLDVTDAAASADTLAAIESRIGPVDLAVLNAGTYRHDSAAAFDAGMFRATIDVNLMGSVNCLAAVLPGLGFGIDPLGRHNDGMFFLAFDPAMFRPLGDFMADVEGFMSFLKDTPPAAGFDEVLYPGELERRTELVRRRDGIPVDPATWSEVAAVAERLGVAMPVVARETRLP